ncbi:hypothetical protein DICPUDRAFT_97088 [Dictyostelium purpureum]|uniref:Uncharacterized protein n=1 Tax=Dictyostelium purpureum TaxID=5786 RepID=F0ZDS3_DICPU|nr:uncharacterized protein DICPUDRAFT_97088 [Dictyostelium purpureum]EGC37897.1 hypothetical protein DICPUDRAFT_97088 [Dictyostelium purpureum]|eukprot:XP_003285557.1 hypothetical protein DICPUDRAFT_97088 [Dictyostelium purpureum]
MDSDNSMDSDTKNEIVFWKVFRNKYLFSTILKLLSLDYVGKNGIPNHSVNYLIVNNYINILKHKILNNHYLSFDDHSFKQLLKLFKCNRNSNNQKEIEEIFQCFFQRYQYYFFYSYKYYILYIIQYNNVIALKVFYQIFLNGTNDQRVVGYINRYIFDQSIRLYSHRCASWALSAIKEQMEIGNWVTGGISNEAFQQDQFSDESTLPLHLKLVLKSFDWTKGFSFHLNKNEIWDLVISSLHYPFDGVGYINYSIKTKNKIYKLVSFFMKNKDIKLKLSDSNKYLGSIEAWKQNLSDLFRGRPFNEIYNIQQFININKLSVILEYRINPEFLTLDQLNEIENEIVSSNRGKEKVICANPGDEGVRRLVMMYLGISNFSTLNIIDMDCYIKYEFDGDVEKTNYSLLDTLLHCKIQLFYKRFESYSKYNISNSKLITSFQDVFDSTYFHNHMDYILKYQHQNEGKSNFDGSCRKKDPLKKESVMFKYCNHLTFEERCQFIKAMVNYLSNDGTPGMFRVDFYYIILNCVILDEDLDLIKFSIKFISPLLETKPQSKLHGMDNLFKYIGSPESLDILYPYIKNDKKCDPSIWCFKGRVDLLKKYEQLLTKTRYPIKITTDSDITNTAEFEFYLIGYSYSLSKPDIYDISGIENTTKKIFSKTIFTVSSKESFKRIMYISEISGLHLPPLAFVDLFKINRSTIEYFEWYLQRINFNYENKQFHSEPIKTVLYHTGQWESLFKIYENFGDFLKNSHQWLSIAAKNRSLEILKMIIQYFGDEIKTMVCRNYNQSGPTISNLEKYILKFLKYSLDSIKYLNQYHPEILESLNLEKIVLKALINNQYDYAFYLYKNYLKFNFSVPHKTDNYINNSTITFFNNITK